MREETAGAAAERPTDKADSRAKAQPSTRRKWLILLAFVAVIIAVLFSGIDRFLSFQALIAYQDRLEELVANRPVLSGAAFVSVYALVAALSLPGGLVLTVTGGFLFGGIAGSLLTISGATLGVAGLYVIARNAFAPLIRAKLGERLEAIDRGLRQGVWSYLLFLRLVPLFPFWAVNLAATCLQVPLIPLLVTTFLGIWPATLAYSFAGAAFADVVRAQGEALRKCEAALRKDCGVSFDPSSVLSPQLIAVLVAIGVLALAPALIKQWRGRAQTGDTM